MRRGKCSRPVLSVVADLGFALWAYTPDDLTPEDFRMLLSAEGFEEELRRCLTDSLVLRERLRIRRVGTSERQLFEDTLRRERRGRENVRGGMLVGSAATLVQGLHRSATHGHRERAAVEARRRLLHLAQKRSPSD